MKIQYHPASGRRTVVSLELSPARQKLVTALLLLLAAVLGGFPLLFSTVLVRWRRGEVESEVVALNQRRKEALELATSALRQTASRLASDSDLLGRIAFLYDQPALARQASAFPVSARADPGRLAATEAELEFLRGALQRLEEVERANPRGRRRAPRSRRSRNRPSCRRTPLAGRHRG